MDKPRLLRCHDDLLYPTQTVTSHPQASASTTEVKDDDKRHEQQKQTHRQWLLKAAAGALLVMGGVGFIASEMYDRIRPAYKIKKGIRKAKCCKPRIHKPHIERKELDEYLRRRLCKPTPWTRVVYGPCGAGKTDAVRNVLKDQEAVIPVALHVSDLQKEHVTWSDLRKEIEDKIVKSILLEVSPNLSHSLQDNERCWVLKSVLQSMKDKNPRVVPTLLIEVYGSSYGGVLELLYFLKQWVHRRSLVNAIVVLSPANEIGDALMRDVRASVVKIDHLTMDETKDYLLGICKHEELNGNQQEKEQLAKELAPIIGNRLLDLRNLANDVRELEGGTLDDLKTRVHKQAENLEREYEWKLHYCLSYFKQSDKFKKMLHKLLRNESVGLFEFREFYKKDSEKCNGQNEKAKLSRLLSHVFYVDIEMSMVTIDSSFTRKALEKHLMISSK